MTSEIEKVEVLKSEVAPVVQRATEMRIVTPDDYSGAAEFLKTVKGAERRVTDFFAPMVAANLAATRATTTAKAQVLDPLLQAEGQIKKKQLEWSMEQERIRQKEQVRLQADADERARRERESLLKKAATLKTPEKAEALREQAAAVQAPSVSVASVAPEIKGQSIRKTWKAKILDPKTAVMALVQFPDWEAFIEINQGQLDKFAARTKGSVRLAGVEWYESATLSSTSK